VIRVSVEVNNKASRFRAAVWAESIEQAVNLARARYPGCEAKILFPIDPEAFFAKEPIPAPTIIYSEEAAG
jgi:hypothetical protein